VAQKFLYRIDISAVIHQMGSKGMTQHVRAFFIYGSDQIQVLFDRSDRRVRGLVACPRHRRPDISTVIPGQCFGS
jgi:hypothetical protein